MLERMLVMQQHSSEALLRMVTASPVYGLAQPFTSTHMPAAPAPAPAPVRKIYDADGSSARSDDEHDDGSEEDSEDSDSDTGAADEGDKMKSSCTLWIAPPQQGGAKGVGVSPGRLRSAAI